MNVSPQAEQGAGDTEGDEDRDSWWELEEPAPYLGHLTPGPRQPASQEGVT